MGRRDQVGQIGALVVAAEQHDGTGMRERRQRFERGVDVGGLRIVVAFGAAHGAARLDAMLERAERGKRLAHGLVGSTGGQRRRGGGKRVAGVVRTLDLEAIGVDEGMLLPLEGHDERAFAVDERGVVGAATGAHVALQAFCRAHGDHGEAAAAVDAAQAADLGADDVVGGVHDRDRARDLSKVVEHLHLGGGIVFQRMVPMQMVGRDVEQHGHIGREQLRGCELIRRHLGHVDVGFAGGHGGDARVADVADGAACHARGAKQMVGQSGDGGLAVGSRDGDPRAGAIGLAPCELDLADDLVAYGSGRAVQVGELGDARACDAQLEMPAARLRQAIDRALAELDDGAAVARLARIRIGSGIGLPAEHGQLGHAATELRHEVVHGIMAGLA